MRILLLVALFPFAACSKQDAAQLAEAPQASNTYGEPLRASSFVPLENVLAAPEAHADKMVAVTGRVRKACSKKGCWMELAPDNAPDARGCRVTFKDYGFFVPLDAQGKTAFLEGTVALKTVPKDEVDHLEQEGAKFPHKNDDGTAHEVRIIATGVRLESGS